MRFQCVRTEEKFRCFGMRQPLGPIGGNRTSCQIRERCPLVFPPEFKSLSLPFSPPACFCHAPKEGEGLVSLESPAPYGGILSTRVVGLPPRISSPSVRCLPAALFFGYVFPHHHGTLWTFTTVCVSRRLHLPKAPACVCAFGRLSNGNDNILR